MTSNSRRFRSLLGGMVFLLVFACTGQATAQSWTQLSPTGVPPSVRDHHSAVYDSANNRMMVFAGDDGSCSGGNDVWVLSNADGTGGTPVWTQLNPTGGPPE